jgi:hypothetical protein
MKAKAVDGIARSIGLGGAGWRAALLAGSLLATVTATSAAPQTPPRTTRPPVAARAAAKPAATPPRQAAPAKPGTKAVQGGSQSTGKAAGKPTGKTAGKAAGKAAGRAAQKGAIVVPPAAQRTGGAAVPAQPAGGIGREVLVLFDEVPGLGVQTPPEGSEHYVGIYQDNADLGARSGVVNPTRVVAHARTLLQSNPNARWGMLDFEFPYDEILMHGPTDPRHAEAVNSLIATVRAVRAEFPQVRWTYYGFPRLPYWIGVKDWGMLSDAERAELFAKAHASYGAILDELDWVQPSLYDRYEDALEMPRSGSPRAEAEAAYRRACVEVVAKWFEGRRPAPPILPAVSPWFQAGGRATVFRAIPREEFLREQVRPAIAAGASGISIWGAMNYYLKITTVYPAPTSSYSTQWRPIARTAFASEHFGGKTADEVSWADSQTKQTLAAAFRQAFMQAVDAARSAGASATVASGDER